MTELDERRVVEALRTIPGDLAVTDRDLEQALARLHEELPLRSHRRRTAVAAIAATAAVAAGLLGVAEVTERDDAAPVGPTGQARESDTPSAAALIETLGTTGYSGSGDEFLGGPPPSREDVVGLWLLRQPFPNLIVFDADGRWRVGSTFDPWAGGRYSLEGDALTRTVSTGDCGRREGLSLPWAAGMAADGSLRLRFTGVLNTCTPADDREVWDRLAPGRSPVRDYLIEATAALTWQLDGFTVNEGLYFAPRTGNLLEIFRDGRFRFHDFPDEVRLGALDSVAEAGRLTTDHTQGATTVHGTCRQGDFSVTAMRGRIPEVPGIIADMEALRFTASRGDCSTGIAAGETWVRLIP